MHQNYVGIGVSAHVSAGLGQDKGTEKDMGMLAPVAVAADSVFAVVEIAS